MVLRNGANLGESPYWHSQMVRYNSLPHQPAFLTHHEVHMHIIRERKASKAATNQPNKLIDTGSHKAYLDYAMSVVIGRPRRHLDAVAAKVGTAARRRTAGNASAQADASGTEVSGHAQGSGGAGDDGNSDGGDGDGDGPERRATSRSRLRRTSLHSRPAGRPHSSSKPDPNLPHRRGLKALVLITLILVSTALIFALTDHEWLAVEVMGMAGGLPFLARHLVKPK